MAGPVTGGNYTRESRSNCQFELHQQELALLERIYDDLRLYLNCFQPSVKLIAKERIENKTFKRYEPAQTPYQRVLERKDISVEAKARLAHSYVQHTPAELRRPIDQKLPRFGKFLGNILS